MQKNKEQITSKNIRKENKNINKKINCLNLNKNKLNNTKKIIKQENFKSMMERCIVK